MTRLCLIVVALAAGSCGRPPDSSDFEFLAFGTIVIINIAGTPDDAAFEASEQVRLLFDDLHREWHAWEGGELAAFNARLIESGEATASRALIEEIQRALSYAELSGQRFHPGVAMLVREWGFAGGLPPIEPPSAEAISAHRKVIPDTSDIVIEMNSQGATLRSPGPGWAIDLGGIAKGVAVDLAIQRLRSMSIENAIVNAGGDLRAIGSNGGRPWRVGIRDPRSDGIIGWIETDGDDSVFTSGDYERFFFHDGQRYHHILDPATGLPALGSMSVTVVADDGGLADAAATALFVAGKGDWVDIASAMGIELVMLITADGSIEMTADMAQRIQLETDATQQIFGVRSSGPEAGGTLE